MTVTTEGLSSVHIQPAQDGAVIMLAQHGYPVQMSHRMTPDDCRKLAQALVQIAESVDPTAVSDAGVTSPAHD